MTVSEAKGSCDGGNFSSRQGQLGKSTRSEDPKIEKETDDVDELSEEVSQISLSESKCDSTVLNNIDGKLEELAISSDHRSKRIHSSDQKAAESRQDAGESKVVNSELNITESREDQTCEHETEQEETAKPTQKCTVFGLNIIVNGAEIGGDDGKEGEDEDASIDGELCSRSPMRLEHVNVRSLPYQERSLHHSSGGTCVADRTNHYFSTNQNNGTANSKQLMQEAGVPSSPVFPFCSDLSPAGSCDESVGSFYPSKDNYGDIGVLKYDPKLLGAISPAGWYGEGVEVDSEGLDPLLQTSSNNGLGYGECHPNLAINLISPLEEIPYEDVVKVFNAIEQDGMDLNQMALPVYDSVHQNANELYPLVPESVAELNHISSECTSRTVHPDYSPPSVSSRSSGYNSSCSPRSTNSTPSPGSSLKGSQETIYPPFVDQFTKFNDEVVTYNDSSSYFFASDDSLSNSNQFSVGLSTAFVAPKPIRIEPKPTFSQESAKERLAKKLDKAKKGKTWAHISTITEQDLSAGDADGDTQLMILLLKEPIKGDCKLEMIYALVTRLKTIPDALTAVNRQGQSALYLAALHCPDLDADLITRYIAETLLSIGASLDACFEGGETILHCLCQQGMKRFKVFRELLSLHSVQSCFQLDKFNHTGMTPLHVATSSHQAKQLDCINIVRLLINAGANATILTANGARCSPLNLAINGSCDPNLISALLTSPEVAATCGDAPYRQDTPLHMVARRNDLPLVQQCKVYMELVAMKAHKDARDSKGKLPLDLLAPDRKEAIKQMIQQK